MNSSPPPPTQHKGQMEQTMVHQQTCARAEACTLLSAPVGAEQQVAPGEPAGHANADQLNEVADDRDLVLQGSGLCASRAQGCAQAGLRVGHSNTCASHSVRLAAWGFMQWVRHTLGCQQACLAATQGVTADGAIHNSTERGAKTGPKTLEQGLVSTYDGVNHAGGGDEQQQGTKGHSNCCGLVLGLQASRACSMGSYVRRWGPGCAC